MKTLLAALSLFLVVSGASVQAKKHHGSDANAPYTIIEANAVSVTVSVGKSGDVDSQKTFKINDNTGIMIDNVRVPARNLKGGMEAQINLGPDGVTATWINAHDPKR